MSATFYSFDDSPVKLPRADALSVLGPTDEIRILSSKLISKLELSESLMDEGTMLVSMKASGCGNKPLKSWIRKLELELDVKESGLEEAQFWKAQFDTWNVFKGFNPKLLAAADVLETLQMRLTSFFEDTAFIYSCRPVTFGPFAGGLATLSYQNLLWHQSKLKQSKLKLSAAASCENDWCEYAMSFAERKYIEDLMLKGFDLPADQVDQAMVNLRKDVVHYFTKLKADTQRNDIGHVFSTAVEQKVYTSGPMGNKNRALCDIPKWSISGEQKDSLIAMVDNLSNLSNLPGGLEVLTTAFPMQLFFLKKLLTM